MKTQTKFDIVPKEENITYKFDKKFDFFLSKFALTKGLKFSSTAADPHQTHVEAKRIKF